VSADAIAAMIDDFKRGHVQLPTRTANGKPYDRDMHRVEVADIAETTVIDATVIFRDLDATNPTVDIYDETLLRPVLDNVAVCFVNSFGNTHVVHFSWAPVKDMPDRSRWETDEAGRSIDWSTVEWVCTFTFWIGGHGEGPLPTSGPVYAMAAAVHADGTVEDFRWYQILDHPNELWTMATIVALRCITFLNCRNVIITEPARDRAQRRRLARYGVTVNEVRIAPVGRWSRAAKGHTREVPDSVPLTTVRGHIAKYGVDGRGLLFGRIAGTFWIPAHARGNPAVGTATHDYTITEAP
jgi:hypothetical protein